MNALGDYRWGFFVGSECAAHYLFSSQVSIFPDGVRSIAD
jgi:hypothetical protein